MNDELTLASVAWKAPRRPDLLLDADRISFNSEADLRDGIGTFAYLSGWSVATEVPVHGGARLDLVLFSDEHAFAVEMKTTISSARALRLGLAQVDSYRRLFSLPVHTDWLLVANKVTAPLSEEMATAYCPVEVWTAGELIANLRVVRAEERLIRASRREAVEAHRAAVAAACLQSVRSAIPAFSPAAAS